MQFRSVQFSHSVVSDFSQPHEPQDARLPCPLPTPRVHPNPGPFSQWCHATISSSVIPFSFSPQSFPASGSFQISSSHQVAKVLEFQLTPRGTGKPALLVTKSCLTSVNVPGKTGRPTVCGRRRWLRCRHLGQEPNETHPRMHPRPKRLTH